ncbi:hypothetical protein, partial [Geobacillus stearothermophilus]
MRATSAPVNPDEAGTSDQALKLLDTFHCAQSDIRKAIKMKISIGWNSITAPSVFSMFIKCVYYYLLYLLTFSYVKRLAPVSKKKK